MKKFAGKAKAAIKVMLLAAIAMIATQNTAFSADGVVLKSVVEVEKTVVNAAGKKETKRVEVSNTHVTPGDILVFTTFYTNTSDKPAKGIVIKNPVPKQTTYLSETAEGKDSKIEFSVDKGRTFGPASSLKIKTQDGKERTAGPGDYSYVKWSFSGALAPRGKGAVSFKAKVK